MKLNIKEKNRMRGTGFKITLSGLSLTGTNIKPLCWGSLRYPPPQFSDLLGGLRARGVLY